MTVSKVGGIALPPLDPALLEPAPLTPVPAPPEPDPPTPADGVLMPAAPAPPVIPGLGVALSVQPVGSDRIARVAAVILASRSFIDNNERGWNEIGRYRFASVNVNDELD